MITTKVAFVLQLTDDFSGKVISRKKFMFQKNGQLLKPVEKEEGLYVFLEPMGDTEWILITGADYYPYMVKVEKETLDRQNPILNVRMYGRPGGSFPYRCSLLEGKAEGKDLPVEVCGKKKKSTGISLKEIRTVDGEQHLIVHGFTKEQLIGKTFAMSSKKDTEVFVITEKVGMNEYKIEGALTGKYPDKTPIDRVYRSVTDENGNYAIPVEVGEQEQISEVIILQHKSFHHKRKEV